MKKTAIYARQSIDKKDSISVDSQIEFCKRECENPSIQIYEDRGFSGKNTKRPAFEKMMQDVQAGLIDKIVCYRLDRFSRSISDFSRIWEVLKQHEVAFVSTNEKFDTSTPVGTAMVYIVMIFAQLERETIAERVKDNYYQRLKKGAWPGGPAPYGFELIDKKKTGSPMCILVPNEGVEIIKMIFNIFGNQDISLRKVAHHLNTLGIPAKNRNIGKWNSVTIARILHNPTYVKADVDIYNHYKKLGAIVYNEPSEFLGQKGLLLIGKRTANERKYTDVSQHLVVISSQDGIIDSDLFLRCHEKLKANINIKNSGKSTLTWLSGITKCGKCGYRLSPQQDPNGCLRFVCTGRGAYGRDHCDARHSERIPHVEDIVANEINKKSITSFLFPKEKGVAVENANEIKLKLLAVEEKIKNLISNLSSATTLTMQYINEELARLESQRLELVDQLKPISEITAGSPPLFVDVFALDFDGKKNIAQSMIERIDLLNEELNITWKA